MKRISLILACLVLIFSTKASAFVGGPFDNGDYSRLLDDQGIYQVAFRFSNGSGFAQFGTNVDADLFLSSSAAGGTSTGPPSSFSYLNRSMVYYKGVTYLGTCTGMVDHEAKLVQGVTNGTSDLVTSATTTAGGTSVSASNSLIYNGLGFPCNTEFRCKITKSYPVLKFSGKGELSIINPSVSQVVFAAITEIITAGGDGNDNIGEQIGSLLDALQTYGDIIAASIPSAQSVQDNSDRVPMTVFGSRIFFVSRR